METNTFVKAAGLSGPVITNMFGNPAIPYPRNVSGPCSHAAALTNVFVSIEHDVEVIADCIEYLRDNGYATIEATEAAQQEWSEFVNTVADFTVYPQCNSWYLGANIPGKPRVFMTMIGFPMYVERVNDVIAKGYEGFTLTRA